MTIRYKVELVYMLNENITCVINKGYFRDKRSANRYCYKLLFTYYRGTRNRNLFKEYAVDEEMDKVDNITKISAYLYMYDPYCVW